jgi:glycine hydroxymethyltransferase
MAAPSRPSFPTRDAAMPHQLHTRAWVPLPVEIHVQSIVRAASGQSADALDTEITRLVAENYRIHDVEGINLNPASNVMNPRAEQLMAAGLGTRASLGYPGDKYEMGLEAIERIEVIAAQMAAEVFKARFAEVRVGSGALANLYVFMACCQPGDTIIASTACAPCPRRCMPTATAWTWPRWPPWRAR